MEPMSRTAKELMALALLCASAGGDGLADMSGSTPRRRLTPEEQKKEDEIRAKFREERRLRKVASYKKQHPDSLPELEKDLQ
jgi:hypothetical protein